MTRNYLWIPITHRGPMETRVQEIARLQREIADRQMRLIALVCGAFGNVAVIAEGIERDVNEHWEEWSERATEVLNSLHGIAHINPTLASVEMARAIVGRTEIAAWKVAAQIGDLTNPPEEDMKS